MRVGQLTCGKIEAKLEEWPLDGNKHYVKLYALDLCSVFNEK